MRRGATATLVACGALLALAARAQDACTYTCSGYLVGLPVLLPVTYLTPGLANWKVAVPVPAECAGGVVAGRETLVCDHGARPAVRDEAWQVRVRRAPPLAGYATVQLTVYCALRYPPPPPAQQTAHHVLSAPPRMWPERPYRVQSALPSTAQKQPKPKQSDDMVSWSIEVLTSYDDDEESKEESSEYLEKETEDEGDLTLRQ